MRNSHDERPELAQIAPNRGSEGDPTRQPVSEPQNGPFCMCGHDKPRHRRGKCWTDFMGLPLARTRTAIACPCTGWEPTP